MTSWLIIFAGLYVSWQYMDLGSMSFLASFLAPLLFVVFLIALLYKLFKLLRSDDRGYGGDGGGWSDSGFGDDGGCGGGDGGGD